jgi:hypothetical protein
MSLSMRFFVRCFFCALLTSPGVYSQTDDMAAKNSLALRCGYSWLQGDWTNNRVAPAVKFFEGNVTFEADLEFRLSDRLSLGVQGGYTGLDMSDWQNYASSRGGPISASSSMTYGGIMLRPHLKVSKPDIIKMEFGPVALFASGKESVGGRFYNYDFFKSMKVGAQGGIEYLRLLNENFGISLKASGIVVPSGVEYADGETRTVTLLPITLGIRFLL